MNFSLAEPRALWLLLLVVLPLSLFLWWSWRKRQELVTQFISARLLASLKVGVSPSRQKLRMALLVAGVVCLVLALARPQWGYTWEEARQRGLDIIVAIDTSKSMLAEDTPPNRLARAKLAALDLMRRAKTDRMGLIAFAGDAFLVCPLTLDDAAFAQSVDSLDTHTISQGGTALAEAISTAKAAFKDEPENHRVLVLFTDGEDLEGGAVNAAEAAAKEGLKIYTIGIGSAEGELLRVRDDQGRVDYIRDDSGKPVKSHLNEALLQEIASKAGGFYLPLRGTRTMDVLYDNPQGLGSLPKSTTSSKMFRRYHERYHWFLSLAIALLIAEMFIPDRKRRRSRTKGKGPGTGSTPGEDLAEPSKLAAKIPRTEAVGTAAILLLFVALGAAAGPSQALREYEQGKYQDALRDYSQLVETRKDDPRLHFNAGAAAYQSRKMDEAVKQFGEALNSPDLQLQQRAYYNLGNSYYRLGQQGGAPSGAGAGANMPGAGSEAVQKAWEQAIKQYESALKLNPQDPDAKFNRDFVQKRLEELKKQQQQNQSKNQSGKQNQNQQNQQSQNSKEDQNQQQQNQQQQNQNQQSQQQQNSQAKNQNQEQQQGDQQSSAGKQNDQQKQAQAQPKKSDQNEQDQGQSGSPEEQSKEEAEREAAMMAAGQMTPQQARQLLDAQKGEDQVLRLAPPDNKGSTRNPTLRDW